MNFRKAHNQLIQTTDNNEWNLHGGPRRWGAVDDNPETVGGYSLSENVALVAPKITDIFWVHPDTNNLHDGVVLDPWLSQENRPGIRAAYRSASYILRAIISQHMDIEPSELQISLPAQVGHAPDRVARIIISDKMQNGAGFAVQLYEVFPDILEAFFDRQQGARGYDWIEDLLDPAGHAGNCQTSCTSCIRYYSNMREHGLMDWRLGVSLLRIQCA